MLEHALVWWVALAFLGAVAIPYLFVIFPGLPGRGLALARPFGVLLTALVLWYLGTLRIVPNGRGAVLLAAVLVVLGSFALVRLQRTEVIRFVRRSGTLVIAQELLFALLFFGLAFLRAHDPDIAGTEKPMDFAMLNTAIRSEAFPPRDPWLSGFGVNYYYFGYLIVGAVTQLAGTPPAAGYNLGLAFAFAAAGVGMAGLVTDMVAQRRQRGEGGVRLNDLGFGALAALLLAGMGNLLGVLELARAHGQSSGLLGWLAIKRDEDPVAGVRFLGIPPDAPYLSAHWYPDENWWWWRATRVIDTVVGGRSADYTITEFPAFSFILGDLHPHVMALPFVVIALTLTFHLFLGPLPGGGSWWRSNPWMFLPPVGVLGSIGFINGWDLLPYLALYTGAGAVRIWLGGEAGWRVWADGALWAAMVGAGALLLYLPFYGPLALQTLTGSGALGGQGPPVVPWDGPGTRPAHFVVLWAPALLAGLTLVVTAGFSAGRRVGLAALGGVAAMVAMWVAVEVAGTGRPDGVPPQQVAWIQRTWFLAGVLLVLGVLTAYRGRRRRARATVAPGNPVGPSLVFALVLVGAAFVLFWLCETVRIRDVFSNRMNTVFKLYYQAWVLLAAAAAFTVCYLYEQRAGWSRVFRIGWLGAFSLLVLLASVYSVAAGFSKANGFRGTASLDGLAHLRRFDPAEADAIAWLRAQRTPRNAVVLEATGPQYSRYARFSSSTGVPTVLGWSGHQTQWRGSEMAFRGRTADIDAIYNATDKRDVLPLIAQYGITHIAVGSLELEKYPLASLNAFDEVFAPAFRNDRVTIYRAHAAG